MSNRKKTQQNVSMGACHKLGVKKFTAKTEGTRAGILEDWRSSGRSTKGLVKRKNVLRDGQ